MNELERTDKYTVKEMDNEEVFEPLFVHSETKNVDIGLLYETPLQTFEMDEIPELKQSIQVYGLLTPLTVCMDENGRYEVLSGNRRYRAIKELKQDGIVNKYNEIPCMVLYGLSEAKKGLIVETTNIDVRKGYDEMPHRFKIIEYLKQLVDNGEEKEANIVKRAAKYFKRSERYAAMYKAIFDSENTEIREATEKGQISVSDAARMTKLPQEAQKEIIKIVHEADDGNVSGSYELNLNISAEKVTLRLYAIVREGQIYFYDLNCFGIYAGEDKQKLPKDCMTLKEYQELWKERQRQLIKEYQEEFLEGKLLREKIQDIQLSEKSSNKCKCDARRHLLHKTFPDDLAISTDISISKQDCVDHLCGFINLKEKIKQKLIDENNDLSLRLAKNLVVKDYMEKHINVEPWELELVENLKDSMKSVKLTFECNGRTVEGRVLVASLLLNLNCGYDFDLYDFTSISEGKKVFSKLKTFCLPGMSKLFCKDIVLITYNGKTLYKRAKK